MDMCFRPRPRSLLASLLTALSLTAAGCHRGTLHNAASLPLEFMAPRVSSLRDVDFSRMARSVSNNNLLYPGDVVELSVATGLEDEQAPRWKIRVAENGTVNVPLVGSVPVAGLELTQAEQAIRAESIRRGKFVDPHVSLIMDKRNAHRVTVVGAVEKPGTYQLPSSSSDVLAALVSAGGLRDDAGTIIEIKHPPGPMWAGQPAAGTGAGSPSHLPAGLAGWRGGGPFALPPRTVRVDLEQVGEGAMEDLHLEDGSTMMVMRRPQRYVHVIGLVKQADQFEMPEDQELRLLDALALAGGRTLELADKVHVIRTVPGQLEPVVIEASVRDAKSDGASNIRLASGDVVSVEETPVTFVVGTIREFVRFGFSSAIPGL